MYVLEKSLLSILRASLCPVLSKHRVTTNGLKHTGMIDQGIHVNMTDEASIDHDGSVLDYSRLHDMTIQAWSPYQYGFFEGSVSAVDCFPSGDAD